ncbi:hypothetical protein chiPu_0013469 [Chiloscyllium punctatum]|uniref:Uncharacterized protein n=1 Tax=Chiloscyllium punctatum TaxID=137246 RepID=A0A401SX82_CHIPU|nr:hypothetical protein [Chiloscyllium punctatum]
MRTSFRRHTMLRMGSPVGAFTFGKKTNDRVARGGRDRQSFRKPKTELSKILSETTSLNRVPPVLLRVEVL